MNILLAILIPVIGFTFTNLNLKLEQKDYNSICLEIKNKRSSLDSTELKDYFITSFYTKVFPFWKGTKWDYEGHTNTPGDGLVACGYFVSTPLKHMGLNWNRYKLAQMYASKATDAICDSIHSFYSLDKLIDHIKKREDNIYHLGLSFHVGLIIKYKGIIKFLHSDYINMEGVKEENLMESEALKHSDIYYVGRLTNPTLFKKWKNNTEILFD